MMKKKNSLHAVKIVALACVAVASPSVKSDPAWWTDPATYIFDVPQNTSNWSPANVGQLKHVAIQAKKYLDLRLAGVGGAGSGVDAITNFDNSGNFSPLNVGQLKNVAKPFYDRLAQVKFNWQTGTYGTPSQPYPWTGTTHPENGSPANLGQMKYIFSFEISDAFLNTDSDGDGLKDWWEYGNFGDLTTVSPPLTQDPDGDGLNTAQEQAFGSDPQKADTDADGLRDNNELSAGRDPRTPDHPLVALRIYLKHP